MCLDFIPFLATEPEHLLDLAVLLHAAVLHRLFCLVQLFPVHLPLQLQLLPQRGPLLLDHRQPGLQLRNVLSKLGLGALLLSQPLGELGVSRRHLGQRHLELCLDIVVPLTATGPSVSLTLQPLVLLPQSGLEVGLAPGLLPESS